LAEIDKSVQLISRIVKLWRSGSEMTIRLYSGFLSSLKGKELNVLREFFLLLSFIHDKTVSLHFIKSISLGRKPDYVNL